MNNSVYELKREEAMNARRQASELRQMYKIATCGLTMEYGHKHDHTTENWVNYGTCKVPYHLALRIADQYPVWAAEYDAIAERIEAEMESMFAVEVS